MFNYNAMCHLDLYCLVATMYNYGMYPLTRGFKALFHSTPESSSWMCTQYSPTGPCTIRAPRLEVECSAIAFVNA